MIIFALSIMVGAIAALLSLGFVQRGVTRWFPRLQKEQIDRIRFVLIIVSICVASRMYWLKAEEADETRALFTYQELSSDNKAKLRDSLLEFRQQHPDVRGVVVYSDSNNRMGLKLANDLSSRFSDAGIASRVVTAMTVYANPPPKDLPPPFVIMSWAGGLSAASDLAEALGPFVDSGASISEASGRPEKELVIRIEGESFSRAMDAFRSARADHRPGVRDLGDAARWPRVAPRARLRIRDSG